MNTEAPTLSSQDREGATPFVRAFVAVGLPDEVRSALVAVMERLRSAPARVAWVPGENLHLSLAFLGNVPAGRVADVAALIKTAVSGVKPACVKVRGLGTFGPPRFPRVVWAGVEAAPLLIALQSRVTEGLIALGVPLDNHPFHPHITLGRIKAPAGCAALAHRMERFASSAFGEMPVCEVLLMRSELRVDRAVYSALRAVSIG